MKPTANNGGNFLKKSSGIESGKRYSKILTYFLLIVFGIMFILPFIWMLSASLKNAQGLFQIPPRWIPNPIVWEGYKKSFVEFPYLKYGANTMIITVMAVVGSVISSSLVAYSFAKLRWPGREFFFMVLLTTMMLPSLVTIVPQYILFKNLRWINTYYPLIVPWFFGSAFYIFLLKQFFRTIPGELSEAAKMDGCPEIMIFSKIIMALSKPALATVAIFTFMFAWNDFFGPMIYINEQTKYTLALGVRAYQAQSSTGSGFQIRWNVMMATSVVVVTPIIIIFFAFQRYFIEGITLTGIKG